MRHCPATRPGTRETVYLLLLRQPCAALISLASHTPWRAAALSLASCRRDGKNPCARRNDALNPALQVESALAALLSMTQRIQPPEDGTTASAAMAVTRERGPPVR